MASEQTRPLDRALARLATVLRGLDLWVDSGSLLALHRNGRLLDWDGDIDFSCWENSVDSILARKAEFEQLGYRVAVRRLRGTPYKIKLTPRLRDRQRGAVHVDISIYRRVAEWAVSPGIYRYRPKTPVWKFPHVIGHSAREALLIFWIALGARRNLVLRSPRIDMRLFSWCVPYSYFEHLAPLNSGPDGLKGPEYFEEYLTYRYGDWRTPQRVWDYFYDDRSVLDERPEFTLRGERLPDDMSAWVNR